MNRVLCGALLLSASLAFAQQQSRPTLPPYTTPPTFPEGQQNTPRTPPDMPAPPQRPEQPIDRLPKPEMQPSARVAQDIHQQIKKDPLLQDSNVKAVVDDATVTLTGTVNSEQEHQNVLRIVAPYAGRRNIVDNIKVRS